MRAIETEWFTIHLRRDGTERDANQLNEILLELLSIFPNHAVFNRLCTAEDEWGRAIIRLMQLFNLRRRIQQDRG